MKQKIDWAAAKAAMLGVAERYFGEIPRHRKVRCPFHSDTSPSLHVYDDGWHCFGCGEHGDAVDLVAKLDGVDKVEALRRVTGENWVPFPVAKRPEPEANPWVLQAGAPGMPTFSGEQPSAMYAYHDGLEVIGYVCRFEAGQKGDRKTFRQVTSRRHVETGELAWRWIGFDAPTPLYRADVHRGTLVIVEGEKCVEHLRAAGIPAGCWLGGVDGVKKADWASLTAQKVILWPDNDDGGHKAMAHIAAVLEAAGVTVAWVDVSDLPAKADAADLDASDCLERIRAAKVQEAVPDLDQEPEPPAAEPRTLECPLRFLGYQETTHFFLHLPTQVIMEARPEAMTRNWLIAALGLSYLEGMFIQRGKWNAEAAVDKLLENSRAAGFYNPAAFRGRGVWLDDGRVVYHAGDAAYIDGKLARLSDIQGKLTYPINAPITRPGAPLDDTEAGDWILTAACQPSWMLPVHGYLLSGWVVCSMLAGVLPWRPSLWIQAPAGSGKSEILKRFLGPVMGDMAEVANGDSTEAGVRQRLKFDARAVICEEAESQDEADARRMKGMLSMMRQSSSEGAAQTFRGTVSGRAVSYHARAPWCFISIQSSAVLQADRERLTKLTLRSVKTGNITKAEGDAAYKRFLAALDQMPDDISARLLGRVIGLAPIAKDVIAVMVKAIKPMVQNTREADQLGALMAGAWMLQASHVPSHDEAKEYLEPWAWDEVNEAAQDSDSERALDALLNLRLNASDGLRRVLDRLLDVKHARDPGRVSALTLAAYGLSWKAGEQLFVCHNNANLCHEFAKTPYRDLGGLLASLPGVTKSKQKCGGPTTKHGLLVPLPGLQIEPD